MHAPLFLCSLQNCGFVAALITLIREKIPLLVLSVISCLITFFVQQHGGGSTSCQRNSFIHKLHRKDDMAIRSGGVISSPRMAS